MKTELILDHPKQHLTDTYAKAKHRYSLNHLVLTDVIRNLIIEEKIFRSISFCNKGIYPANNSLFSFIGLCMAIGHFFLSCLVTGLSVFKEIDFCPFVIWYRSNRSKLSCSSIGNTSTNTDSLLYKELPCISILAQYPFTAFSR